MVCSAKPPAARGATTTVFPGKDTRDGTRAYLDKLNNCEVPVELVRIEGGGHSLPGLSNEPDPGAGKGSATAMSTARSWFGISSARSAAEFGQRIRRRSWASIRHLNDIPHNRIDFIVPAAAAEDAIMADTCLHAVQLHMLAQPRAKVLCRERLTEAANIVPLAFHGQQRGAPDGARIDRRPCTSSLPSGKRWS